MFLHLALAILLQDPVLLNLCRDLGAFLEQAEVTPAVAQSASKKSCNQVLVGCVNDMQRERFRKKTFRMICGKMGH